MGGEKQSEVSVGADAGSGDSGDKGPQEPAGMEALDANAHNARDGLRWFRMRPEVLAGLRP